MAITVSCRVLNGYYLWVLSSYQSLSMCLYDADAISRGVSIGYGLDGYDLCRFIFPPDFFTGSPNPHHRQIASRWETFFADTDARSTFGLISPFALLELLATIVQRASGAALRRILDQPEIEIVQLLDQLVRGVKALEDSSPQQRDAVQHLARIMKVTKNARRVLLEGTAFEKLALLSSQGRLRPLERLLPEAALVNQLPSLLAYDERMLSRAIRYLSDQRQRTYSEYSTFYNTLDVYHYVLFDNVGILLHPENLAAFVSSSGILSRNSWLLTKYGKFLGDIEGVPPDWSARSSDAPSFLAKALRAFRFDHGQTHDFFEEARALARVILRDFHEIPQVVDCIGSPAKRERLLKTNPPIQVKNKVPQAILRFQHDYYRKLVPEFAPPAPAPNDIPMEVDLHALYEWITNPETRSREFRQITDQVGSQIRMLSLPPIDWATYIAPLGDTAYDILKTFDPNLDI